MKGVVLANMVCAEKRTEEKSLDGVIEEMPRMLSTCNYQEMLSITIPKAILPAFEALTQRARARGDERVRLRTVAAKPANSGMEEDCAEQQVQEVAMTTVPGGEDVGEIAPQELSANLKMTAELIVEADGVSSLDNGSLMSIGEGDATKGDELTSTPTGKGGEIHGAINSAVRMMV